MFLYEILVVLIIFIGVWLAGWVYLADPKSRVNIVFSIFTISFLLWAPLPYFFNLPLLSNVALYLVRFGFALC